MTESARGQNNEDWLKEYYGRLQNESQFSSTRRDNATNWALTLFLGIIAAYVALLTSQTVVPSVWRIGLLLAGSILLIRFFVQSTIAYSFLRRWRYLENQIECHWAFEEPDMKKIVEEIRTYDHGRHATISRWDMIKAQLRSGFLLVFIGVAAALLHELRAMHQISLTIWVSLTGFLIYVIWEIYNFTTYDQLNKPSTKNAN
jgi:hypothetical protein